MTYEEAIEYATAVVEQWKDWVPESSEQYKFYKLAIEIIEKVLDGKMIELPCKVGDTVYYYEMVFDETYKTFIPKLTSSKIVRITIERGMWYECLNGKMFPNITIGSSIFRTKGVAEKALKEREEK